MARGTGGGAACDGLGFVSVKLKWPRGSDHELDQIGFEYRLVQGSVPEGVVPGNSRSMPCWRCVRSPATGTAARRRNWYCSNRSCPVHPAARHCGRVAAQAPRPGRVHCDAHAR